MNPNVSQVMYKPLGGFPRKFVGFWQGTPPPKIFPQNSGLEIVIGFLRGGGDSPYLP